MGMVSGLLAIFSNHAELRSEIMVGGAHPTFSCYMFGDPRSPVAMHYLAQARALADVDKSINSY
jgi:hypothetical protein